jgi:hypothetical protein
MARGDRQSDAAVAQQLEEIIDLANTLPGGYYKRGNQKKIADEVGVNRTTIYRNLKPLVEKLRETNPEKFIEGRLEQKEIYELMERALVEGTIPPDVARAWQSIRDSISRLMGYDAPSKSLHVNVVANQTGRFHKFVQAAAGLTETQLEQVFKFAASLEREPLAMPAGPPPLMLESGAVEEGRQ